MSMERLAAALGPLVAQLEGLALDDPAAARAAVVERGRERINAVPTGEAESLFETDDAAIRCRNAQDYT